MNRTIRLCLWAALLLGPGFTGWAAPTSDCSSETAIKEAVLATNAAMIAAANRLDVDAFFTHIVDGDTMPVVQNGAIYRTHREAKDAVNRAMRGVVKIDRRIDHPQITVLGPEAALLIGEGSMTATMEDGRQVNGTFSVSLVFVRRDSAWKLLHGHYSVPPPM